MDKKPYAAFVLSEDSRNKLLELCPPKFSEVRCDHITIQLDTQDPSALFTPEAVEVVGYATDGNGIEALLVKLDGEVFKPDGSPWHVTISFQKGQKAPKELDPFRSPPAEQQPDQRKPRKYVAGMSRPLLLNALSPEDESLSVKYLDTSISLEVTPKILRVPQSEQKLGAAEPRHPAEP